MGSSIAYEDIEDISDTFSSNIHIYNRLRNNIITILMAFLLYIYNCISLIIAVFIVVIKDMFWRFYPFHKEEYITNRFKE